VYEQIFGKVGVFLTRDFLAKGLLPAFVLLMLLGCLFAGPAACISALAKALSSPRVNMGTLLSLLMTLLSTSALLMVFAPTAFGLFDGSLLPSWLKDPLRAACERDTRRAQIAVDTQASRVTVLKWLSPTDDERPRFIPPLLKPIDQSQAKKKVDDALTLMQELQHRNAGAPEALFVITRWQRERLIDGIDALRQILASRDPGILSDGRVDEWKSFLRDKANAFVTQDLDRSMNQDWARMRAALTSKYPNPRLLQPTLLGNAIGALDEYSESRYKIPTSLIWSRVWWILTGDERDSVGASKLSVDTGVNLSFILSAFALVSLLMIVACLLAPDFAAALGLPGKRLPPAVILCGSSLIAAVLSYRMTVSAVRGLAEKVCALVDLHRLECLVKLGFTPITLELELSVLQELRMFLGQASSLETNCKMAYSGAAKPKDPAVNASAVKPAAG